MDHIITPFHYEDIMYVSDTSSLIMDPLQIKVEPGEYTMKPYFSGFVYTKTTYEPEFKDIVKVLNTRDGDPGLEGTYHGVSTANRTVLRFVNNYFVSYVDDEWFDEDDEEYYSDKEDPDDPDYVAEEDEEQEESEEDACDEEEESEGEGAGEAEDLPPGYDVKYEEGKEDENRVDEMEALKQLQYDNLIDSLKTPPKPKRLRSLTGYNNLPILFFLNTKVTNPVARHIILEKEYEDENMIVVWNVIHLKKGKIGVAIGQKSFHCMMGDQMGLAVFSVDEAKSKGVAFANFDAYNNVPESIIESELFYPRYETNLEYNPHAHDVSLEYNKKE